MAENAQEKGRRDESAQGGRPAKSNRGFAAMDPKRQREIASEGGRAAHQQGRAHEFTSEEAREAGRKGGMASGGARRRRAAAARSASQGSPSQTSERATDEETRPLPEGRDEFESVQDREDEEDRRV